MKPPRSHIVRPAVPQHPLASNVLVGGGSDGISDRPGEPAPVRSRWRTRARGPASSVVPGSPPLPPELHGSPDRVRRCRRTSPRPSLVPACPACSLRSLPRRALLVSSVRGIRVGVPDEPSVPASLLPGAGAAGETHFRWGKATGERSTGGPPEVQERSKRSSGGQELVQDRRAVGARGGLSASSGLGRFAQVCTRSGPNLDRNCPRIIVFFSFSIASEHGCRASVRHRSLTPGIRAGDLLHRYAGTGPLPRYGPIETHSGSAISRSRTRVVSWGSVMIVPDRPRRRSSQRAVPATHRGKHCATEEKKDLVPTFRAVDPAEVVIGRGRAAAEARTPYIEALRGGDAGRVHLERGEKLAAVKRLLREAARRDDLRIRSSWTDGRQRVLVWKKVARR